MQPLCLLNANDMACIERLCKLHLLFEILSCRHAIPEKLDFTGFLTQNLRAGLLCWSCFDRLSRPAQMLGQLQHLCCVCITSAKQWHLSCMSTRSNFDPASTVITRVLCMSFQHGSSMQIRRAARSAQLKQRGASACKGISSCLMIRMKLFASKRCDGMICKAY